MRRLTGAGLGAAFTVMALFIMVEGEASPGIEERLRFFRLRCSLPFFCVEFGTPYTQLGRGNFASTMQGNETKNDCLVSSGTGGCCAEISIPNIMIEY